MIKIPAVMAGILALALLAGTPLARAETGFLADMDDLPLAPGLVEIEAERLVFDKAEGRILRTAAQGGVPRKEVRNFYIATLPALGWTVVEKRAHRLLSVREHEQLEITLDGEAPVTVRFALQPR